MDETLEVELRVSARCLQFLGKKNAGGALVLLANECRDHKILTLAGLQERLRLKKEEQLQSLKEEPDDDIVF
jgi:hypothetical protein